MIEPNLKNSARLDVHKPLRLLFVVARYLPFVGGTEIHTYEVGRRLAAAGNQVTVLTTDLKGALKPYEQIEGIEVMRVPAYPRGRDYYYAPGISKVIASGEWDLVHCQGYHTLVAPLAMLAAQRARLPYLLSFHSGGNSSRLRNAIRKYQRLLLRPLLQQAERLVAVSNFEAEFFSQNLRLPREQFAVIPNGAYLPRPNVQPAGHDGTIIVSVGRLERYKGHHRILAAMPRIREAYPDARLLIVGEGPYKESLQQMAHSLGIAGQVEIGGLELNAREEMAGLFLRADLVTLFSEYEAFPIAVLEALFLGRSVLVSDTSGLHELAEQGLVNAIPISSSTEAVAAAVVRQLREPLEPSNVNPPSWDVCARELDKLYQAIASRREAAAALQG